MRVGEFELAVVRPPPDGTAFPEVAAHGKTYAVAAPGEEFELRCSYLGYAALPPGYAYQFLAKVDGRCVGVSKLLSHPGTSTTFQGFLKGGDTSQCSFNAFVFAAPKEDASKEAHSLDFQEGKITAEVYQAMNLGLPSLPHYTPGSAAEARVARLAEGKKFFLAPSLTTQHGEVKQGSGFSSTRWEKVGPCLARFELRYETAGTLSLRQVLQPSNPQHKAIIDSARDARQQQQQAAGVQGQRHAGAEQQQQQEQVGDSEQVRSRGGVRIKRERQQQGGTRVKSEVVDLTANENDEVLAASKRDEVLTCDLTGEGEDEPQWKAVKKRAVQL